MHFMDPSVCPCANTDPSTPPYPAPSADPTCFLTFLVTKGLYKLCPVQRQDSAGVVLKLARNGHSFTVHLLPEDPGKVAPAETGKATRSGGRRDPQAQPQRYQVVRPSQLPSVIFGAGGSLWLWSPGGQDSSPSTMAEGPAASAPGAGVGRAGGSHLVPGPQVSEAKSPLGSPEPAAPPTVVCPQGRPLAGTHPDRTAPWAWLLWAERPADRDVSKACTAPGSTAQTSRTPPGPGGQPAPCLGTRPHTCLASPSPAACLTAHVSHPLCWCQA